MLITSTYLGFPNDQLLRVYILPNKSSKKTKSDDNIKSLGNVELRRQTLPPLNKVLGNISRKRESFSINSKNVSKDNSYYLNLINKLYLKIRKPNPNKIKSLDKGLDKINKCKYVIYAGYKDDDDRDKNVYPTIMSIFQFNQSFTCKRKSRIITLIQDGTINSYFRIVPNKFFFQLPFDKSYNIANFYKNSDNNFVLDVYSPSKFDKIFHTTKLKEDFVKKAFNKFTDSKKPLTLTKDGVKVSFVKSFSNRSDNTTNIIHSVYSDKYLMNSMASFTGDGHSTIKQVHEKDLSDVLKLLKDYSDSHKKCEFKDENIPHVINSTLFVTSDSMPIFCSLLKNNVAEKLLDKKIYIPYYNEK